MPETFLIYGLHAVLAVLKQDPGQVRRLWLDSRRRDRRMQDIHRAAQAAGIAVLPATREELVEWAGTDRHQGAVAEVAGGSLRSEKALLAAVAAAERPLLLVLDGVQDPHNLGACLRSADAAGALGVVVPRDRACGLTPVVRKVAAGAAESVPLYQVTNLARALRGLQQAGLWCIGLDAGGDTALYATDLTGPVALVLGAEGAGLRRLTRETCDQLVALPMAGTVASLNVSVTAGIALFEAVRQRQGQVARRE